MITLKIKDFSAISEATISLGRFTVIIGPQASGKSVICKLNYFFYELLEDQNRYIAEGRSFDYFKDGIKEKFAQWFPISAWGKKRFTISFEAGDYSIRLVRTESKKVLSSNFRLFISDAFINLYTDALQKFQARKKGSDLNEYEFEFEYQVHRYLTSLLPKLLGKEYISNQVFIPAGRSFFTNIGKAVAAFEQGNVLDPLTVKFGRLYTSYKQNQRFFLRTKSDSATKLNESLASILGGKHVDDGNNKEYVLLSDGRKIPLSALSSGQQELLPLLAILPYLMEKDTSPNRKVKNLVYIEEPEAHLFPMAQSALIEILAKIVKLSGNTIDMIVTTHSPYVLAKLNNLIKAGQISRQSQGSKKDQLSKIIDEDGWLAKGFVEAYSINEGILERIIDDDGLISADYLDSVSIEIGEQFSSLLDIEFSK
jgi:predicted ATPase